MELATRTHARHLGHVPNAALLTVAAVAAVLAAALTLQAPLSLAYELLAVLFLVLTGIGTTTLVWMLYAWRDGDSLGATAFPASRCPPAHSFSLIVPARQEERVLAATLARLAEQEHPEFEVIVVVGHDDPGTLAVAQQATARDPRFRIVIDTHDHKNKPRALNTGLPHCRGDVVAVFDAEDQVAPRLLLAVDARFQATGFEVVQGATQLMNYHSSWYSVRNVLEYYFWFKSRLHFQAKERFIPLGGNTVFVRRDWLIRAGGWDPDCLAEDCELGARLSSLGARTVVAYSADLVTREEAPGSICALVRQRTRWNRGFLQVLRKREWRRLPLRQRLLAGYTLSLPFIQALTGLTIPVAVAATIGLELPILLALLTCLPLVPLAMILVVELVGLTEFGRDFGLRPRVRDRVRLIVGAVPYQLLLTVAAVHAAYREIRGIRNWEKTAHVGAHL